MSCGLRDATARRVQGRSERRWSLWLGAPVADEEFRHPRLAAIYDALDSDRDDLDAYVALTNELGARRVLDVGCGTGTLALALAARGCDVVAVDPATASLAVARAKPGAHRVHWIDGDATTPSLTDRDLVTMTGNTAQAIADPQQWRTTLTAVRTSLRPGGPSHGRDPGCGSGHLLGRADGDRRAPGEFPLDVGLRSGRRHAHVRIHVAIPRPR